VPYLIDGDNLLGTWPGRRRSDAERRELSLELGRIAARERKRIVTIFDGVAPPAAHFGAGVVFSGAGRTADAEILAHLGRQTDARQWVVVTSDRSLGDQCRYLGARVERCDRFRRRLRSPAAGREKPEQVDDVDYWLEQFGDDPD
jgi:predicted RNA-binding protein with PIN domain